MRFISCSLFLAPVVGLFVACSSSTTTPDDAGTSDASTTPTDATTTSDATTEPKDGGGGTDATSDAAPSCKNNGFTSVADDGFVLNDGSVGVSGQSTLASPVDTLELSLLPLSGSAVTAGKRTLTAKDASYADCSTCVLIRTKCDENLSNCAKTFIATQGTLDITAFSGKGQRFEATADVTLVEVTIARDNTTTPVPNGETWCLTNHKITVASMQ